MLERKERKKFLKKVCIVCLAKKKRKKKKSRKSMLYNVQILKDLHSAQLEKRQLYCSYYGLWVKVLFLLNYCFFSLLYFDSLTFLPVRSTSARLLLKAFFIILVEFFVPDIHLECIISS